MTNSKKILFCLVFSLALIILPALGCLAADNITTQMQGALTGVSLPSTGTDDTKAINIVGSAIAVFLSFLGILFLILIIYGGYKWLMAMGREEEIDKAKDIIKSAVVGLIVILSAYGISYFVTTSLERTIK